MHARPPLVAHGRYDDGSCAVYLRGCTDPAAINYQPAARESLPSPTSGSPARGRQRNQATVCVYGGCTDVTAANFDPSAMLDDGSCIRGVRVGCMRPSAVNFDRHATAHNDATCIILGCTRSASAHYDAAATLDDGSCGPIKAGCTDRAAANYDRYAAEKQPSACVYLGCADSNSPSFEERATIDDGSCGPLVDGCADPRADNYNSRARYIRHPRSSTTACVIRGCTSVTATNFDPVATVDDRSCAPYPPRHFP